MTERDPLTVLAAELPKLAAEAKKLKHPMLDLLIEQAQAELATLAKHRGAPSNGSGRSPPPNSAIRPSEA
jgi:hypothetical protein